MRPILEKAKSRRRNQRAGVVILAAALAISTQSEPAPSWAAAGDIQVSPDGVTFSNQYPGSLFDSIGHLVPGDTDAEMFYLRNSGNAAGFLRLTVRDVVSTNTDFAQALTVTASTPGYPGEPVVVGSVNPCWVLLERHRVEPGETVGVTAQLALGDLHGQAGQGATAGMVIRVSLSDTSAGTLPPTDCGGAGTDVSVLPTPSSTGSGTGAASNPPLGPSVSATGDRSDEAVGDLPVLNLPGGIVIDPNTWHLHEEYLVLILLASLILGSGWFMMVARRRRRADGEAETDVTA